MNLAQISRIIERSLFAALLGALLAIVLIRLLLLVVAVTPWVLLVFVVIGAWSGAFLSNYSQRSVDAMFDALRSHTPQLRALCLKVMLWLLGSAAVIGVLTVLTANYDVVGRVGGTVLACAIAAGFLWPLSLMIDRPKMVAAGLYGMAAVIVVFSLVIPLIWEIDQNDEEMAFTSLVIGLTAPAGVIILLMIPYPKMQCAGRIGMALFVVTLAVFCVAIWHPAGRRAQQEWWEFGCWLTMYGGLAVACLAGLIPSKRPDWRWLGVLACAIALYLVMLQAWGQEPAHEKVVMFLTSISLVIAHTSLTLFVSLAPGQSWVMIGTSVAVVMTAVFFNCELFMAPERGMSILGRTAGAGGVVASCGTLALMVLARLNRRRHPDAFDGELADVTLFCPQCGKKQTLALGGAECSQCSLRIDVTATRQHGS